MFVLWVLRVTNGWLSWISFIITCYKAWIFSYCSCFEESKLNKLERLIGAATTTATTANKALKVTPLSSRSSLYQRQAKPSSTGVKRSGDSTQWHFRKRVASETESTSEPDLSVDSGGDSLPPMLMPPPVIFDKTLSLERWQWRYLDLQKVMKKWRL